MLTIGSRGAIENRGFSGPTGRGIYTPQTNSKLMEGANGTPSSPTRDYANKHWGSVGLSVDLHQNSAIPIAIRERLLTYVIGAGLQPEPHLPTEDLNISVDVARKLERDIARHYRVWEKDKRGTWDKRLTPLQAEKLAFSTWITHGDVFCLYPTRKDKGFDYKTRLKLIAPSKIRTPLDTDMGLPRNVKLDKHNIVNGIELDSSGADKRYWIANYYAEDVNSAGMTLNGDYTINNEKLKFRPYNVYAQDGTRMIHHIFSPERLEQLRGIPFIAGVVNLIQACTTLTENEIVSAIVKTYFNVIITDDEGDIDVLPDSHDEYDAVTGDGSSIDDEGNPIQGDKNEGEEHSVELQPAGLTYIPGSKKVHVANPNIESATYEKFLKAIITQIGAALGISYGVLMESFGESYSASRAEILMSFKKFYRMREEWIEAYKKPLWDTFIKELADLNVIPVSREELENSSWLLSLWSTVQWRGPSMGHIQPLQEAQAMETLIDNGLTTREAESKELNPDIDYRDMRDSLHDENMKRAEHFDKMNQLYPLNTGQKITLTRSFIDVDEEGIGNMGNAKEGLKKARADNSSTVE